MKNKIAFLSGITGQTGSYLAELLLDKGYTVHGIVRRSSSLNTSRIDHIWPKLNIHFGDLADGSSLARLLAKIQPDEVFNLGAQSHVRVSFDIPEFTADVTGLGTLRLLEAIRESGGARSVRFYQAGSSEMFGLVQETPQRETTPFWPRSPYGAAKVYAHWITVNYRESFGMHASNGLLFNHECLTAETPIIFRRNGWLDIAEIQELVTHRADPVKGGKKYQAVPKNLEIFDGDKWSKVTLATATWNAGEKQVFRVEARGGYYCATGDHKSFREGRVEEDTKNLKPGDRLQLYPLPIEGRQTNSALSADEAEFLGLMAGDGYVCPEGGSARFTNLDEELLRRSAELFGRLTGGRSRRDDTKKSGYSDKIIPSMEFSGASPWFALWRHELYNERRMKKVPARVFNAPQEIQLAFLRGYNRADGLNPLRRYATCKAEFKCWVTNSPLLAAGLWFLGEGQGLRLAMNYDKRGYFRLNIGEVSPFKGAHLQKPQAEVKSCNEIPYVGWLFDLATESGTFSAGIGRTWVHNSPRRGETFVTRKVAKAAARIRAGLQSELFLGNLDAKRDWGFAKEYAEGIWLMLQQDKPDDYVRATGETHSVHEFVKLAFERVNLNYLDYVRHDQKYERPAEVDLLLGDASKAKRVLGWEAKTKFVDLVNLMVDAELAALKV